MIQDRPVIIVSILLRSIPKYICIKKLFHFYLHSKRNIFFFIIIIIALRIEKPCSAIGAVKKPSHALPSLVA